MSNLLFHSFPTQIKQGGFTLNIQCPTCGKTHCSHQIDFIYGFQKFALEIRKKEITNDLLNAILLNEKVFINASDFYFLPRIFKNSELRTLFEKEILEIVYNPLGCGYIAGIRTNLGFNIGAYESFEKYINHVEEKLSDNSHNKQLNQVENDIITRIETNPIKFEKAELEQKIIKEIKLDLKNKNVTRPRRIRTSNLNQVNYNDAIDILSICNSNRALVIGAELGVQNILLDSASKENLNNKFGPTFYRKYIKGDKQIEVFQEITELKGIPNLGELYIKGIITVDNLLKIRESLDGKVFRIWYESNDYNREETLKKIINSVDSKLQGRIAKHFRWVVPLVAGVVDPLGGVTTSYANSFIVDKVLTGYHPNLFLDKVFRKNVEAMNLEHRKKQTRIAVSKRKAKVKRNDNCPCGSGKKYKRCCLGKK